MKIANITQSLNNLASLVAAVPSARWQPTGVSMPRAVGACMCNRGCNLLDSTLKVFFIKARVNDWKVKKRK